MRTPTRWTRWTLTAAACGALLLTGCSSAEDEPEAAPPAPAPSATPPPAPEASRLVVETNSTSVPCLSRVGRGDRVVMHDPTLVAEGDLEVTGVDPVPQDGSLRLLGAEVVTLTSRPDFGPGISVGEEWPIPANPVLRRKTDWEGRSELVGRRVADGERIMPLVGVVVGRPGGTLDSVLISYRGADGATATVEAPIGARLSRGSCR